MSVASLIEKINDLDVVEIKTLDFDLFLKSKGGQYRLSPVCSLTQ